MALSLLTNPVTITLLEKSFCSKINLALRYTWIPSFSFGWVSTCTYRIYWFERWKSKQKDITYYNQASSKWQHSVILVLYSWRKSNTLNIPGERNSGFVPYRFLKNLLSLTVLIALFSWWCNSHQMKTSFLLVYEELKWNLESKSTNKNVSLEYFFSINEVCSLIARWF